MSKITDPDVIAACEFLNGYYDDLGGLAPARGSREERHAIMILAAYIKDRGARSSTRVELLEAALREIVDNVPPGSDDHAWLCAECARRALDGERSMCSPREVPPSMRQDAAETSSPG